MKNDYFKMINDSTNEKYNSDNEDTVSKLSCSNNFFFPVHNLIDFMYFTLVVKIENY